MKLANIIAVVLVFFIPLAAQAQNFELHELADNEVLVNLHVMERTQVQQNKLIANLEYTVEGEDRRAIQDEINRVMAEALERAGGVQGVDVSTSNYNVYLYHDRRPVSRDNDDRGERIWRGQQGIKLESLDSAALLNLAGELQSMNLNMVNMYFTLSPDVYEETADGLTADALAKLQNRADAIAKALGKSSARLIRIDVGSSDQGQPRMMMARESMMAVSSDSIETPVAEPSMTDVSLSISAAALLK